MLLLADHQERFREAELIHGRWAMLGALGCIGPELTGGAIEPNPWFNQGALIFQDGGLLANNPSAIALHEARLLFPQAPIACLASFGTGAFAPTRTRGRDQ